MLEWFLQSLVLKQTESDLWKINWLRGVILFLPIVLVPWGRFPLCHTPIRPISAFWDQISLLVMGCVITRFASTRRWMHWLSILKLPSSKHIGSTNQCIAQRKKVLKTSNRLKWWIGRYNKVFISCIANQFEIIRMIFFSIYRLNVAQSCSSVLPFIWTKSCSFANYVLISPTLSFDHFKKH